MPEPQLIIALTLLLITKGDCFPCNHDTIHIKVLLLTTTSHRQEDIALTCKPWVQHVTQAAATDQIETRLQYHTAQLTVPVCQGTFPPCLTEWYQSIR